MAFAMLFVINLSIFMGVSAQVGSFSPISSLIHAKYVWSALSNTVDDTEPIFGSKCRRRFHHILR